jgi:hypothetical protein
VCVCVFFLKLIYTITVYIINYALLFMILKTKIQFRDQLKHWMAEQNKMYDSYSAAIQENHHHII